jgi:lipid II:glycine glycyltransferase (peptidoglycan interpeptide bridge formation enzyme)
VYKALYGQKLLACGVMIDFGKTRTYLFGGTSAEDKNLMAPYALHFQAMQDAKNSGLEYYDFWGIETASGEVPGFVRFKMGFGGEPVAYPPAQDLIMNRLWYNAYKVLRKINKKIAR